MSHHLTVYHGSPEAVEAFRNTTTSFTPSFSKAVWYARRLATLRPVVYKCRLFVEDFDLRRPSCKQHYAQMRRALPNLRLPQLDADGFLQSTGLPTASYLDLLVS